MGFLQPTFDRKKLVFIVLVYAFQAWANSAGVRSFRARWGRKLLYSLHHISISTLASLNVLEISGIEAFGSQFSVETLALAVLPRAARVNENRINALLETVL
jgi:hypothetical protein